MTREQLVAEIADCLAREGQYEQDMYAGPAQHMVDLHWCAHLAGRRLGMKVCVRVVETPQIQRSDHVEHVTVTVVPRANRAMRSRVSAV